MAYKSNKPAGADKLRVSQGDIQGNFADIKTAFDVNHVALTGTGGDEGKHKFIQMPEQVSGSVTTAANEAALYALQGPISGVTELAWREESNGDEIVFTEASLANPGWSRFASGLLAKWTFADIATSTADGSYTVAWPVGPGAFSTVFAIIPIPTYTVAESSTSRVDPVIRIQYNAGNTVNINYYYENQGIISNTKASRVFFIGIGTE